MAPLANGMAVNEGVSLAISCCQPPNRSAISLTTLILLVSTTRRMQPTRQNRVSHRRWRDGEGKGNRWEGRGLRGGGGAASRQGGGKGRGGGKGKEEWGTNPYS